MKVERLFLAVPRGCLRFVIVVFPDHTHLLFLSIMNGMVTSKIYDNWDNFNLDIVYFPTVITKFRLPSYYNNVISIINVNILYILPQTLRLYRKLQCWF